MNFADLYKKIASLDGSIAESVETVEECGMAPAAHAGQQDSVNMNVTMSGSGEGGIRELLNVLKDIDTGNAPTDGEDPAIFGEPSDSHDEPVTDEDYSNDADNTVTLDIDAVTPTGDDMHSKGAEAEKANGGGNPWNQTEVSESLLNRLAQHYQEVKDR